MKKLLFLIAFIPAFIYADGVTSNAITNNGDGTYTTAIGKDNDAIIIGNKGSFLPQASLSRWNGEEKVTFRYVPPSFLMSSGLNGNIVSANYTNQTVDFYSTGTDKLEIEIDLSVKPSSNVFVFGTTGADNFRFLYQPPLNEEKQEEGIVCTDTGCIEIASGTAIGFRPENVVGSYAVYHATKAGNFVGGNSYETGKAFHIYRPKAIDAKGNTAWGMLAWDEATKILRVHIPQKFLDTAVYPVNVDPTFGYTSIGASVWTHSNRIETYPFAISESGTVQSISMYLKVGGLSYVGKQCFFVLDGTSRLDYGQELSLGGTESNGWFTRNSQMSATLSAGTYYLGFNTDNGGVDVNAYDTDAGANNWDNDLSPYVCPCNINWTKSDWGTNRKLSIYVTYSTSGGGRTRRTIVVP